MIQNICGIERICAAPSELEDVGGIKLPPGLHPGLYSLPPSEAQNQKPNKRKQYLRYCTLLIESVR